MNTVRATLTTVARFTTLPQAQLARAELDLAGIPSFLSDGEIVGMDWMLGNAVGDIKLQVSSENLQRARSILAKVTKPRFSIRGAEPEGHETQGRCLKCSASMSETETHCPRCGWSFQETEADQESETGASTFQRESPADSHDQPLASDRVRAIGKPLLWLTLVPLLLGAATVVVIAFGAVLQHLLGMFTAS